MNKMLIFVFFQFYVNEIAKANENPIPERKFHALNNEERLKYIIQAVNHIDLIPVSIFQVYILEVLFQLTQRNIV